MIEINQWRSSIGAFTNVARSVTCTSIDNYQYFIDNYQSPIDNYQYSVDKMHYHYSAIIFLCQCIML